MVFDRHQELPTLFKPVEMKTFDAHSLRSVHRLGRGTDDYPMA